MVLLDVELDDGTGMDLLGLLDRIDFQLIFITAFNKYAINAFKFSAIDFLLKPFTPGELVEAFNKASQQIRISSLDEQVAVMQETLATLKSKEKKIVLKDSNAIYIVNVSDIIRCQSHGQYTEIYTEDRKMLITRPLKEYEEMLEPYGFIRPHHSHLVNLSQIERFDKIDGGFLILKNRHEIPVSQRKKTQIIQIFDTL